MADRSNDERLRELTVIAARERARVEEIKRLRSEVERVRADLREAVELLGAFNITIAPGELNLHERRTALLATHKETP